MNACLSCPGRRRWRRVRGVLGGLALCLVSTSLSAQTWASGSLRPTDTWNTVTLDMSVSKRHVTTTNTATGAPSPRTRYRIERSNRTGAWKTIIWVLSVDAFPSYTFNGALRTPAVFPVSRLEDDENGTPVRVYDRLGNLMPSRYAEASSATTTLSRSGGREWLSSFVATTANKSTRLLRLQQQYGAATAVGTLSRYFKTLNNAADEVLVEPNTVVAVERNGTQSGKLRFHRTFKYAAAPDGALVRSLVQSETVISDTSGERAISETAFSNVRLELRR